MLTDRLLLIVELSTEAQRSFFEFKSLLENAHERGRQLLELTGDKVAEHVMCATRLPIMWTPATSS